MDFASDNTAPAHPKCAEALAAETGAAPAYGEDRASHDLQERLREVLGAPKARVWPMASGTATNATLLAALAPPWGVIYCHESAHIEVDERGAAGFYAGGAKLRLLSGPDGAKSRIDPGALARAVATDAAGHGIHAMPPAAISATNLTEYGEAYAPADLAALSTAAPDLPLHLDGARFANALAATKTSAPEMTATLAALSLGMTKLGAMIGEAAVLFDPDADLVERFESQRMRGGHNLSKARYISAQMNALLDGGLWLDLAAHANAMAARLARGLGAAALAYPVQGNMVFARLPMRAHEAAFAAGARYHLWETPPEDPEAPVLARLVTSWTTSEAEVDALLAAL